MSEEKWQVSAGAISSAIGEEIAILDIQSSKYHTLNETAACVWRELQTKKSLSDLSQAVSENFDITPDECHDDVANLIGVFLDAGLIERC